METLFIYFGKVILFSGVMFLYYQLFLKDKTFHHYNRFYLLATMLISILLPLVRVDYFTISVNKNLFLLLNQLQQFKPSKNIDNDNIYFNISIAILGLVSLFLSLKLAFGITKIYKIRKQFPKENYQGINFYQTNLKDAPFSYFKNLFWKNTILIQSDLGKQILKHEMVHIEQKHTIDNICIEIVKSVFWFNPVFYFIKKEIYLIHEYLADNKAIKHNDTKAFAQMLLAGSFSGKPLPATSPFLNSNLKKRLKMIQKSKTKYGYARKILVLPLLFALVFAYLVNAKNREIKETNKAISLMVSKIKNDTTVVDKKIEEQQQKIAEAQKKVDEQSKKINEASTEINKKSAELNQIAKEKGVESKEYEAKAAEIDELGEKIDELANEHENLYVANLDHLYTNLDKLYEEKDGQMNMDVPPPPPPPSSDFAFSFNTDSKEFKKQMEEAKKQAKKAAKMMKSKKFQKEMDDAKLQVLNFNSQEFKKQMEQMQKAQIDAQKAMQNAQKVFLYSKRIDGKTNGGDVFSMSSNDHFLKKFNGEIPGQTKIYIDGKASTKEDLDKLNPDKISKIFINKNKNDNKEEAEIRIETKK